MRALTAGRLRPGRAGIDLVGRQRTARVGRGERFGMIKLGSRTEIILPDEEGLEIKVKVGDKVQAGSTVFARFVVRGS